jgi:hypothetical protein
VCATDPNLDRAFASAIDFRTIGAVYPVIRASGSISPDAPDPIGSARP